MVTSPGFLSTRELLEWVQWRAMKMTGRLSYKERLGELFIFKRRLRGDLINVYKYLNGVCQRMDQALLRGAQQWDKKNGHKLMPRKFHLNTRKNFFTAQ